MRFRAQRSWPTGARVTVIGLLTLLLGVVGLRAPSGTTADDTDTTPGPDATAATTTALPPRDRSTTTSPTEPSPPPGAGLAEELPSLRVADVDPGLAPYRRSMFGDDWSYDPASGCNTRERVLIEESLEPPVVGDRCKPMSGRWRSLYDGVTVTAPADLQIDHFVPLAEAWRSGAAAWSGEQRLAFANDLTDPHTLVAVTGESNMSKSDSGPHEWLPPDRTAWCTYVDRWVEVKARWDLAVTPAEHDAIERVLATC